MSQIIVPLAELASTPLKDYMKHGTARDNFKGQGRNVNMSFTRDGEPIKLVTQTPRMWCQFGLDSFTPKEGGDPKYSLRLSFRGNEPGTDVNQLHSFLSAIDQANIDEATANQAAWWPKQQPVSREIIADRYTPIVKKDGTGQYDDQMRVKLPFTHGRYDGLVFDDASVPNEVDTSYIEGRCHVICLIEFGPIW